MNIADIVTRQAAARPDAPAVIERGRTWSYAEFDTAIGRASAAMHGAGLRAGDVACVSLESGALYLAASYALSSLGVVQLHFVKRDSPERRQELAARFSAKALLAAEGAPAVAGLLPVVADPRWLEPGTAPSATPRAGGDAGWRIALTSGSTGAPKAVLLTHAMHLFWCEANQGAVPGLPEDRYLAVLDLDFDAGLRHCLFVQFAGGAVMFEPPMVTAGDFFAAAERTGASYLSFTPWHLHQLLAAGEGGDERPRLPGVRVLRSGGMVHTEALRRGVRRRLSPNFHVMYGTNDGGSPLTGASGETLDRHPESVGYPCPGVELGIADEAGRALPAREHGLVRVRAAGLPPGYMDNPEATARSFRDGWYYTGDLGWLAEDGALYFKGRADDLMNYDGIKVYPSEIEAVLNSHPGVTEAAAFALPSPQHQDIPVAAAVVRDGVGIEELRAWCRQKLGERGPLRIAVMRALPRTPVGKVDKRELARMLQERIAHGRRP